MPAFEPVRYHALTDVGVKRSHNQDAFAVQPAVDAIAYQANGHVFVVADGMGGHAVGEKASAKAVRDIPFLYLKHAKDGICNALRRAISETNAGIHAIGEENPEFRGLGTTGTALVVRAEGAWVGHVGDSRCYRIRDGQAEQLTFDHSWVWEIAKRQGVDPDELGDFKKNVIIRSLGPDAEVEVDVEGPHPLKPGDAFLLCSDGLTGVVTPQEVGVIVQAMPPEDATRLLVHLANLRGGPDNITVLIVRISDGTASDETKKAAGAGLGRAFKAWNRLVPWPFTALGGGSALALLSLALRMSEIPGAVPLFLLAAVVILVGLIGLVLDVKKDADSDSVPEDDDTERTLNVYKKHDCAITADVADKFLQIETELANGMHAHNTPADWDAYDKLKAAAESAGKPDSLPAFKARCYALLFLAETFHKSRHKGESFRPNW